MKPNRFERDYKDTAPPVGGVVGETSNKTKLGRSQGKIGMNCDLCSIAYETFACWAKRTTNHFCSQACAAAFKEIKIKKPCGICGIEFEVNPTVAKKVSTCSRACSTKRRKLRLSFCEPRSKFWGPDV